MVRNFIAGVLLVACAVPAVALAHTATLERMQEDERGVPYLVLSYEGLDLSDAAGRAEMEHRLSQAATRVCEPMRVAALAEAYEDNFMKCRSQALTRGRADIAAAAAAH